MGANPQAHAAPPVCKMYQLNSGHEILHTPATTEVRKLDRQMTAVFKKAASVLAARDKLDATIRKIFGPAYDAAIADGRKQVTIDDPEQLRRVVIKHAIRIALNDSAWEAKKYIDDFIEAHTRTAKGDEDVERILNVLRSVFTGRKTLGWNAQVQTFLELELRDESLRRAQKIIKAAKQTVTTRDYVVVERRATQSDEYEEVVRY